MKTSELKGAALDWAVAKCEGMLAFGYRTDGERFAIENSNGEIEAFMPSSFWVEGGPIIEREKMAIRFVPDCYWHFTTPTDTWTANYEGVGEWIGPTPLIAAMRCYVASKLGDDVDVPKELMGAA